MERWPLIFGFLFSTAVVAQVTPPRIPRQSAPTTGAVEGIFRNEQRLGLGNVSVTIHNRDANVDFMGRTSGDGVFRILNVRPGRYDLHAELEGYKPLDSSGLIVGAGELVNVELTLVSLGTVSRVTPPDVEPNSVYGRVPMQRPETPDTAMTQADPNFSPEADRWKLEWPNYHRYGPREEVPYVTGHFYDPYNRNKLKGDYPIFGQTFLALNLTSDTFFDARKIPVPNDISTTDPNSPYFFGHSRQYALVQDFGFSADLFHGDTSFKPIDWRIRVTGDVNVNYLNVGVNGVVNADVRAGTTRLDSHFGLQEAFFEAKLKDLSHNYDFVSARLGIQSFNSDFRGFIFFDQEPGARIFGNLRDNKIQYNLAYFNMLEKDTNSGLNSMALRHQQVMIANFYKQDFLTPGYTIQASYHFDKDDPSVYYDTDNFLERPAPIGAVYSNGVIHTNSIRAHYIGLTGDGHIGRLNINHAFYEVLGNDKFNAIANSIPMPNVVREINAQMAALELSVDHNWIRYRASFFYSSGSKRPLSRNERGFDAIVDNPDFAGGFFSFWNRESIRLLSTGVSLNDGSSLLPSLRSSKLEGQANFVNPGIFIYNAATDIKVTPKLRAVTNVNFLRFDHTEPLALLLFQGPIHAGIGADTGVGLVYRPGLSENITVTGVVNAFVPFQGFRDIFTGTTLFAAAIDVRFRF